MCVSSNRTRFPVACLLPTLTVLSVLAGCGEKKFSHDETAQKFMEALKVRASDEDRCVALLTEVLDSRPLATAYFHRAWIYAKRDRIDEARVDVTAGLEAEPEHSDLLWLKGELDKPADKRSLKMPPSVVK